MKDTFSNFETQGRYILRVLNTNTDIKKVCQICGKPAKLRNNRYSPYNIQLLCDDCRKNNIINPKTDMYNIPTINIKEHLITPIMQNKIIQLNDEYINKFNDILNGNYTKQDAIKYLGVTLMAYDKLIQEYKNKIDSNIEIKLKESYDRERSYRAMETRAQESIDTKCNNLSDIKLKKKMTNLDIYNKVGITNRTISNISNGIGTPKNTTITLIASALDSSVYEVFPTYTEFNEVNNLDDLILLMIKVYNEIYYIWQGDNESNFSRFLKDLSDKTNITFEALRNFVLSTKNNLTDINLNLLNNNDIKSIHKIFKSYNNVEFKSDKSIEFNNWKKKSKIRKRYL